MLLRILYSRGLLDVDKVLNCDSERAATWDIVKRVMGFLPFMYVMIAKMLMHNSAAAAAAALGTVEGAAHTALFAIAMTCFTFGDVGSSTSQAFLPAFNGKPKSLSPDDNSNSSNISINAKKNDKISFALKEARSTIFAILRTTWCISAFVCLLSSSLILLGAQAVTSDQAVMALMKKTLPLIIATLSLHGTAVTLEGLMLAQRKFGALNGIYTGVAATIVLLFNHVRKMKMGLMGVWCIYVWFQATRIILFSLSSGLINLPRWARESYE